jgi:predicted dehydrogenase
MLESRRGEFTAAIIGAGAVGEYHINAQERAGSRVLIYEPNKDRAQAVAQQHNGLLIAHSLDEAIERADVVHVCTPHNMHTGPALKSIEQGKPVIIEKPLTVDLSEAVDIYRAAQATDVPVVVGTSFRLTPPFMEIKRGLDGGEIGGLLSLETTYLHDMRRAKVPDWKKASDRGSFLYGGGSHAVDLNMWVADQPVTEVQARIGRKQIESNYPGDNDFDLSLGYEDGTTGRVWVSAAVPLPRHGADLKVYGTKGAYRAHNKYPSLETYKIGDDDWKSRHVGLAHTIDIMSKWFNERVRGERESIDPLPGIEDGLKVMITLAMLDLASQSGDTVKVPSLEEVVNKQ